MNLVVGATGILGSEICRQLAAKGKPIRALIRPTSDPAKVEELRRLGAELAYGDLKDRPSIDVACRGATAVISTATTTMTRQPGDTIESVDRQGQLGLVDAAKAAGVQHYTFISFDTEAFGGSELSAAKKEVEEKVRSSGLAYTIVQPNVCVETWLAPMLGFDYVSGKATIYGSGEARHSFVSFSDVARIAVQSRDNPALADTTIKVGGPEVLSWNEAIRVFEEVGRRRFEVTNVPEEALRAQLEAAKKDPNANDLARLFPQFGLLLAQDMVFDPNEVLRVDPTPLISVRDYAQRSLRRQSARSAA